MNVVLLSTYQNFGGAAVATSRLHRALLRQGVSATLLVGAPNRLDRHRPEPNVAFLANNFLAEQTAFGRFVAERLAFLPFEQSPGVRFHFSPAVVGTNVAFHPAVQQADLIHLHWTNFGFLSVPGLESLFALGKPVVWTLHDQWAFTGGCHYSHGCENFLTHCRQCPYLNRPADNDLSARRFDRKQRAYADAPLHVVHPSRWLADQAIRSTLLRGFPHRVIPNTLDQTVFAPMPRADANARLNLPDTNVARLLFASANVTDPRKGFRYVAESLQRLHAQHPDLSVELLVFGKGRSYLFDELPYPVRHLGVLMTETDVSAAYNAADALVIPSLEDNLPNTVEESLACGTPVVGFQTGGIPELVTEGHNGFLTPTGSVAGLTDALRRFLMHPAPATLRQNARYVAETTFSEEVVAGRYVALYESTYHY